MDGLLQWGVFRRRKKLDERVIADMEGYLEAALYPVDPRKVFVGDLKSRLINAPVVEITSAEVVQYALLGLAGILSGLIIIITGIRATITILSALGVLRHARSQAGQKGASAAQSVL